MSNNGVYMFKKRGGVHAVNTDGFEVTFRGRDDLIYIEHLPNGEKRRLTVWAEMMLGRVSRSISAGQFFPKHWDAPRQHEAISEFEREHILKRITDSLDFLGITYEVCQ